MSDFKVTQEHPLRIVRVSERWLPVPGYVGYYEVSDFGRVRSLTRVVVSSNGRTRSFPGQILQLNFHPTGYFQVGLARNGHTRTHRVHRLVMAAFVGPCPPGKEVCHYNGIGIDNRRENLRYDTPSANVQDSIRHGTHAETNRTHCPRHHELIEPNLMPSMRKRGKRQCLACSRASSAIAHARRTDRPLPDLQELSDLYYSTIMQFEADAS
jgi:hypothetical protein